MGSCIVQTGEWKRRTLIALRSVNHRPYGRSLLTRVHIVDLQVKSTTLAFILGSILDQLIYSHQRRALFTLQWYSTYKTSRIRRLLQF
jgi:hypothetical protein